MKSFLQSKTLINSVVKTGLIDQTMRRISLIIFPLPASQSFTYSFGTIAPTLTVGWFSHNAATPFLVKQEIYGDLVNRRVNIFLDAGTDRTQIHAEGYPDHE